MPDLSLNWSSASVKSGDEYFELRVELSAMPDAIWCNVFSNEAELIAAVVPRLWFVSSAPIAEIDSTLGVMYGEPESIHQLREELDAIVARTNAAAALDRQAADARNAAAASTAQTREELARQMTDQLRSSS